MKELTPWKPFGEIEKLRNEMDSLWSRFFGESRFPSLLARTWSPSLDISETKDKVFVKIELPGLTGKDLSVNLMGDVLTIKGEKKKEKEEKDEHHYYVERYEGSFERSFRLPATIQVEKIEAAFDKGVLKITLPKTEEAKKKGIEIKID